MSTTPVLRVEKLPDGLESFSQMRFDCATGDSELNADLFIGESVLTTEVVDESALRWEILDDSVRNYGHVPENNSVFRTVVLSRVLSDGFEYGRFGNASSDFVNDKILRDGEDIRIERQLFIERCPILPNLHERVLNNFFGILSRPELSEGEVEQSRLIK